MNNTNPEADNKPEIETSRKRRGTKIGYAFVPVPRDRHPLWDIQSMSVRGLYLPLYELCGSAPIPTFGPDWQTYLLQRMHVSGRDRPPVRKALLHLQRLGLLWFSADAWMVHVAWRPTDELAPESARPPIFQPPTQVGLAVIGRPVVADLTSQLDVSYGNHSFQKMQIRREEKRSEPEEKEELKPRVCLSPTYEHARAHERDRFLRKPIGEAPPDMLPFEEPPPTPQQTAYIRVWKAYEKAIKAAPGQLAAPGVHEGACKAIGASVAAVVGEWEGSGFDLGLEKLLALWLADPWVAAHRPPLSNLCKMLHKFPITKDELSRPKHIRARDRHRLEISEEEWWSIYGAEIERERQQEADRASCTA